MKHNDFDTLGNWCKFLEKNFSLNQAIPTLPIIIRLDGVNFSKWTKGLDKPFDANLNQLMVDLTKCLVKETNAIVGYSQSDEITLILHSPYRQNQLYHNGKKHKILSKLTGVCVNYFNEKRRELLPHHDKMANFDCRMYQVPTLKDAVAQLLWRELDATKNSINLLGQSYFSHNSLQGLNGNQIQNKLMTEKGVNWNDLPAKYKRGVYVRRYTKETPFNITELESLPAKHQARFNPNLIIKRTVIEEIEFPVMSKILNPVDVIFHQVEPKVYTEAVTNQLEILFN